MNDKLERCRRKWLLRCYPGIYLEGLGKATKTLSQDASLRAEI
jgi:hypothetical protein